MASATPFEARTVTLRGRIVLPGPVEEVFPLFSPLGERSWVDGWEPEIVAPRGTDWVEGMVFRVPSEGRMDIWSRSRLVARVEVHSQCEMSWTAVEDGVADNALCLMRATWASTESF